MMGPMTNNTTLTAETITTAQIEALATESAEAGDLAQHAICKLALYGQAGIHREALTDAGLAAIEGMTRTEAREACADAINAGQG